MGQIGFTTEATREARLHTGQAESIETEDEQFWLDVHNVAYSLVEAMRSCLKIFEQRRIDDGNTDKKIR